MSLFSDITTSSIENDIDSDINKYKQELESCNLVDLKTFKDMFRICFLEGAISALEETKRKLKY